MASIQPPRDEAAPRTLRLLERAAAPRRLARPPAAVPAWRSRFERWVDRLDRLLAS